MGDFKDLIVWQKSVDFVVEIYSVTENFPSKESFGLTSQLRRASVSIASNIAEGNSRRGTADNIQFLKISRGSCAEVETQLIISRRLNFLNEDKFIDLNSRIIEILKMLNGLINSLTK